MVKIRPPKKSLQVFEIWLLGVFSQTSSPPFQSLMKENIVLDAIDHHWSEPGLLTDEQQH
jgi:hypothetical protein